MARQTGTGETRKGRSGTARNRSGLQGGEFWCRSPAPMGIPKCMGGDCEIGQNADVGPGKTGFEGPTIKIYQTQVEFQDNTGRSLSEICGLASPRATWPASPGQVLH